MSSCAHVFHAGCIARWLQREPSCPQCRLLISPSTSSTTDTASTSTPTPEVVVTPTSIAASATDGGEGGATNVAIDVVNLGGGASGSREHEGDTDGPVLRSRWSDPHSVRECDPDLVGDDTSFARAIRSGQGSSSGSLLES